MFRSLFQIYKGSIEETAKDDEWGGGIEWRRQLKYPVMHTVFNGLV